MGKPARRRGHEMETEKKDLDRADLGLVAVVQLFFLLLSILMMSY
jgi:hypothetical protein